MTVEDYVESHTDKLGHHVQESLDDVCILCMVTSSRLNAISVELPWRLIAHYLSEDVLQEHEMHQFHHVCTTRWLVFLGVQGTI